MFEYCGNNPISRSDPNGQWWVPALIAVAVVAVVTFCVARTISAAKETKRVKKEINNLPKPKKDITKSFNNTMKTNAQYLVDYQKKNGFVKTEFEFKDKVKTGGEWDFKQHLDKVETYKYNDLILQAQDIGNIHYGYVGASMGFTRETLLTMAGIVQTKRTWEMILYSNGDDLRDQIYIDYGIQLYQQGG